MAILKKSELTNISKDQQGEKMKELRKELMKYNSQRAVGTAIENPGKIRELRRSIAKLYTLINQKKLKKEVKNKKS